MGRLVLFTQKRERENRNQPCIICIPVLSGREEGVCGDDKRHRTSQAVLEGWRRGEVRWGGGLACVRKVKGGGGVISGSIIRLAITTATAARGSARLKLPFPAINIHEGRRGGGETDEGLAQDSKELCDTPRCVRRA